MCLADPCHACCPEETCEGGTTHIKVRALTNSQKLVEWSQALTPETLYFVWAFYFHIYLAHSLKYHLIPLNELLIKYKPHVPWNTYHSAWRGSANLGSVPKRPVWEVSFMLSLGNSWSQGKLGYCHTRLHWKNLALAEVSRVRSSLASDVELRHLTKPVVPDASSDVCGYQENVNKEIWRPKLTFKPIRIAWEQFQYCIHVEGGALLVKNWQLGNITLLQLTLKLCFHGNGLEDLKRTLVFRLQSTISLSAQISFLASSSS